MPHSKRQLGHLRLSGAPLLTTLHHRAVHITIAGSDLHRCPQFLKRPIFSVETRIYYATICLTHETLVLWNQELLPQLQRKHVSTETAKEYYCVDRSAEPVLEFSGSILGEWRGRPSLTQGRIYGIFDNKRQEFLRWYEQIVWHIRKAFVRNPVSPFGYVGPAAYKWFLQGGLLLPGFHPPETDLWRQFFADEDYP